MQHVDHISFGPDPSVSAVLVEESVVEEVPVVEEPAEEPAPRRRGRPRKVVETESMPEPAAQGVVRRRGKSKRDGETKELFPFYEQSLF